MRNMELKVNTNEIVVFWLKSIVFVVLGVILRKYFLAEIWRKLIDFFISMLHLHSLDDIKSDEASLRNQSLAAYSTRGAYKGKEAIHSGRVDTSYARSSRLSCWSDAHSEEYRPELKYC